MDRLLRHNEVLRENFDTVFAIKESLKDGNLHDALMYWQELSHDEMRALWIAPRSGGIFTTKERALLKSDEMAKIRREI